ncbi:SusC/RagA family TonB-linked outer membrane protein [Chitinophaga sp. Ak27]|uniref:SusC/RagA family TonB-linked outer membrane protein n=1 Tax=Chitinophaga sp. Ak27 TaxID=2726116 RepID=UPI00145DC610|nr:SusC/RagA family TonB-linked outer membrane protein [Chitinophaga sp. Ak27]NLU90469.1 SusC/RagA family TonB-linked outer membrane protein [Chitinophaga sp. Ak27]
MKKCKWECHALAFRGKAFRNNEKTDHPVAGISSSIKMIRRFTPLQFALIAITATLSWASAAKAQSVLEKKVSASFNQLPLSVVLQQLGRKTGVRFVYNDQILEKSKPVTASFRESTLKQVLISVLPADQVSFEPVDDKFILLKVKQPSNATVNTRDISAKPVVQGTVTDTFTVKGRVVDKDGTPLPGATVGIKKTTRGTTTDALGNFSLRLNEGEILEYRMVGYQSGTIQPKPGSPVRITLESAVSNLEDAVVLGYGTSRKKDLTGAITTVKSDVFKNIPVTRVDQMLQGKAAGVQVISISGAPGSGTSIRIRGGNSVNADNEPLYVIDGLIGAGDLNLINPEDIESIQILKDASATAIYGARGANGVIIVTTKTGKTGEDKININIYNAWQQVPKYIDMMSASDYAKLANESSLDYGGPVLYSNPDSLGSGTDWQREVSRLALMQNATLSTSGGKDNYHYFVSANYLNQDGIIINSGFKRYQLRVNLDKYVKKNVKVGAILNIGRSEIKNSTVSLGGQNYGQSALSYNPASPVYNPDGTFSSKKTNDQMVYDNPVAQGTLPVDNFTSNNIIGNLFVQWDIIPGLTFKSLFGSEMNFVKTETYMPGSMPTRASDGKGGLATGASRNTLMWLSENTFTYDKQLGKDHHINILAGTTYQTSCADTLGAKGDRYATDIFQYNNLGATDQATFRVGSQFEQFTIVSFLGRISYSYKDKYLFTLTGRSDGASRFAENHKYAFFPAAAVAWRLEEEPFIKRLNVFDYLKLRASYGYNGNQAIQTYSSLAALSSVSGYILGTKQILGYVQSQLPNPNLKWETTRQFDFGLEVGVLKGKISVELDYYNKRTKNLLLSQQLATQTGFASKITNVGVVENRGLELLINTQNISHKNFSWETSFNISGNRNNVVDLGGVESFDLAGIGFGGYSTVSKLQVGHPVGTFWGATYYGVRKSNDIPKGAVDPSANPKLGDPLYADLNGDGKFGHEDFSEIGNGNPNFFGGIGNTFRYKKLSLNIYVQGSFGNDVMNLADDFYKTGDPLTNQYAMIKDRWSPSNPNSNIPRINSRNYIPSTMWVYKGSFLRLKSLNLGYNLSGAEMHIKWINNLNVYITATNLFNITNYPYYDPETNSYGTSSTLRGFDNTNYPQNRTYAIGVNLTL